MAKAKKQASQPTAPTKPQALPSGFKTVKQVICPALSLQVGEPRTLKILEAMRVSNIKNIDTDPKKAKDKPATICPVTDVSTGEQYTLIVPSVMEGNLKETYPDDGYVGKIFFVCKKPKRPGKRYFDLELTEVEAE